MRDAGFYDVRVRHHKNVARIEVGPAELQKLLDARLREAVVKALQAIGYAYVTLDLQGYRRGSGNEVLAKKVPTAAGPT